jgi:hypothetical protein
MENQEAKTALWMAEQGQRVYKAGKTSEVGKRHSVLKAAVTLTLQYTCIIPEARVHIA